MGAIQLGTSLEVSDPILQVGEVGRIGVGFVNGGFVEVSTATQEGGVGDVMLSDEKGRPRAVLADESMAWPTSDLGEDGCQAVAVASMDGTHLRVVAAEQLAGLGEALANGQIFAGQPLELLGQVGSFHHQNLVAPDALVAGEVEHPDRLLMPDCCAGCVR